jgi:hypothetical protein
LADYATLIRPTCCTDAFRPNSNTAFNFQTAQDTTPHPRGAMRPGHACILRHKTEGVGNAGCPPHPQPRVRNKTKHTSMVTTVTAGFTRHSRTRMVLTAYFALSPVIGLYCHRHRRIWHARARSGRHASADLTPASRRQDHTTSPSATGICRPRARRSLTGKPALRSHCAPDAAASTASRAQRP